MNTYKMLIELKINERIRNTKTRAKFIDEIVILRKSWLKLS